MQMILAISVRHLCQGGQTWVIQTTSADAQRWMSWRDALTHWRFHIYWKEMSFPFSIQGPWCYCVWGRLWGYLIAVSVKHCLLSVCLTFICFLNKVEYNTLVFVQWPVNTSVSSSTWQTKHFTLQTRQCYDIKCESKCKHGEQYLNIWYQVSKRLVW